MKKKARNTPKDAFLRKGCGKKNETLIYSKEKRASALPVGVSTLPAKTETSPTNGVCIV